ncbi:MAG: GtrA family protein [Ruminococcus sp.]|nr:GtrA family protein [Ruminococcus sp.]MCM1381242.1 GtrA family protein [Muribaculaceae bacterium]MCM1479810.1 GtrA family protein [Muribaculaceae bacterium]
MSKIVKLTKELYEKFRNLILYGMFGVIAAGIDYGVFFILVYTGAVDVPEIAGVIGNVCGFIFTFLTNTFLNFKKKNAFFRRFLSYFIICACGWGLSALLMNIFKESVNVYILKIGIMIVVMFFQYFMNKYITYRK